MASPFDPPKCITVTHAAAPLITTASSHAEPGVDILVDSLEGEVLPGGSLKKMAVATHASIPLSNDKPLVSASVSAPPSFTLPQTSRHAPTLPWTPFEMHPIRVE